MAKLLIRPPKRRFVPEINREVLINDASIFYIKDTSKDFSCKDGTIRKEDLEKPAGSKVTSSLNRDFQIVSPSFRDAYDHIERLPQAIPPKDVGWITTACGINRDSIIVDSGSGSGAISCFLAKIAKQVTSYDVEDAHLEVANHNKKFLDIDNVTYKKGDITKPIEEKDVDIMILDIPNPWDALNTAKAALKIGGYIVSYSPSITQTAEFVNSLPAHQWTMLVENVEILERPWEVQGRRVRPISREIIHSGFISVVRKISE